MTAPVAPSARPPGSIPKGSPHGLIALGILTGAIPFFVMQSLVPVLKNVTQVWLASLLPVLGASAAVGLLVGLGLPRRQSWYITFVFAFGCLLLAAYAIGLALGAAILLGLLPEASPNLSFISVVNIVLWLIISPLAWLLLRMLRLKYWQPWTTQSDWEAPNKTPPSQTLLMSLKNRKR